QVAQLGDATKSGTTSVSDGYGKKGTFWRRVARPAGRGGAGTNRHAGGAASVGDADSRYVLVPSGHILVACDRGGASRAGAPEANGTAVEEFSSQPAALARQPLLALRAGKTGLLFVP